MSSEMCKAAGMVRKYEQQIRAETAEETRRRVLGAVAQRLRDAPAEPLSLDEVAKLARVARSTIYLIFGSRAGLFEAFTEDLLARTGRADLTKAVAHEDARRHMRDGIAAACRMYAQDLPVYRVLFSMNHVDPASVGGAVERMEKNRAGGMAYLADGWRTTRYCATTSPWRRQAMCCGCCAALRHSMLCTVGAADHSTKPLG